MRVRRWPRLLTGILLVVASGSCSPAPILNVTPAAASLYLDAEPVAAAVAVALELDDGEGRPVDSLRFGAGVRIIAQLARLPGRYTLRDVEHDCEITLPLEGGAEADVRLTNAGDGMCSFTVRGRHDATQAGHLFGAVSVNVDGLAEMDDASVKVRSLDDPPNPVPDLAEHEPDRPDHFQVFGLAPGRYEIWVVRDGVTLASGSIAIAGDGRDERLTLEVPRAG